MVEIINLSIFKVYKIIVLVEIIIIIICSNVVFREKLFCLNSLINYSMKLSCNESWNVRSVLFLFYYVFLVWLI